MQAHLEKIVPPPVLLHEPSPPLASVNNQLMLKELKCAVCSNILSQPLELQCGALVCTKCFQEWMAASGAVNCPCCSEGGPLVSSHVRPAPGIYTGDEDKDDQRLCVVEHKAIRCLCQGLVQQHCCRPRPTWQLESFMKCRDTFWMESFNHQLLTYLPKRIHFHTNTFKMRMNLAVMDWNENTQRASTSHGEYLDVHQPDHHSTYNVLKKKIIQFVRNIWNAYILKNISSLHSFEEEDDAIDELMSPNDSTLLDGEYVDSEIPRG
eukprot:Em0001g3407a